MQSQASLHVQEGDSIFSVLVFDVGNKIGTIVGFDDGGRGMSKRL